MCYSKSTFTVKQFSTLFAKWALKNGGTLFPIFFDSSVVLGNSLFNPSINIDQNGVGTFVFREANYRYLRPVKNLRSLTSSGTIQYLKPKNGKICNSFFLAQYDFFSTKLNYNPVIRIDKTFRPSLPLNSDFNYSTLEDLRIGNFGENFNFIGNIVTENGKRRPFYFEIDKLNCNTNQFSLQNQRVIDHIAMNKLEKNWVPIEGKYGEFVRWPLTLPESGHLSAQVISMLKLKLGENQVLENSNVYGGSQIAKLDDGYISIIHSKYKGNRKNNHRYLHQFFYYDTDLNFIKASKPFTFLDFDTEFCSGLTIHLEKIYLTFSCNDSLNFVLSFDKSALIWEQKYVT